LHNLFKPFTRFSNLLIERRNSHFPSSALPN